MERSVIDSVDQGKTIVDVASAYGADLGGRPSHKNVEQAFTAGKLVKRVQAVVTISICDM